MGSVGVFAFSHQVEAFSDQQSALNHESSVISHESSVISHQPSAISGQPSAVGFRGPTWRAAAARAAQGSHRYRTPRVVAEVGGIERPGVLVIRGRISASLRDGSVVGGSPFRFEIGVRDR